MPRNNWKEITKTKRGRFPASIQTGGCLSWRCIGLCNFFSGKFQSLEKVIDWAVESFRDGFGGRRGGGWETGRGGLGSKVWDSGLLNSFSDSRFEA